MSAMRTNLPFDVPAKGAEIYPMQTLRKSTVPQYSIPVTVFEKKVEL